MVCTHFSRINLRKSFLILGSTSLRSLLSSGGSMRILDGYFSPRRAFSDWRSCMTVTLAARMVSERKGRGRGLIVAAATSLRFSTRTNTGSEGRITKSLQRNSSEHCPHACGTVRVQIQHTYRKVDMDGDEPVVNRPERNGRVWRASHQRDGWRSSHRFPISTTTATTPRRADYNKNIVAGNEHSSI